MGEGEGLPGASASCQEMEKMEGDRRLPLSTRKGQKWGEEIERLPRASVSCHESTEMGGGMDLSRAALSCQNMAKTREEEGLPGDARAWRIGGKAMVKSRPKPLQVNFPLCSGRSSNWSVLEPSIAEKPQKVRDRYRL